MKYSYIYKTFIYLNINTHPQVEVEAYKLNAPNLLHIELILGPRQGLQYQPIDHWN